MNNAGTDVWRKQSQGQREPDSLNDSTTRSIIQNNENQPQRGYRAVGEENGYQSRSESLGGILNQLKRLQSEHLAYVEKHGQRLQQRLQENQQHKLKVIEEMEALESELLRLLEETKDDLKDLHNSE